MNNHNVIDIPTVWDINKLGHEQSQIVDKCLAFNETVAKAPNKSIHNLEKLAQGLELSEKTIEGIQLSADDYATPAISNWTFGTLNMLIQEVGSSIEKDTLLSISFPDKSIPMYKAMIDRIVGNTGIAPEFNGNSSTLPTIRPLDTYGLTYEPGLWGARTFINSKDLAYARKRGTGDFNQRGYGQLVAYNAVNVVTQCFTRKKYLLNQAIFNNSFSYGGQSVSSNIPSSNFISLYQPMGTLNADSSVTYANSDPLYTPIIAITNIVANPIFLKYRKYIKGILCNDADLQAIVNHPNVKPTTNALMMGGISLGNKTLKMQIGDVVKELTAYYAPSFDIPLLSDGDVWVGQNADGTTKVTPNDATNSSSAQNFFVPRGKMFVLLDLTPIGGVLGNFLLTYNEVDPNIEAPAMGLYTGVFNRNLNNSDTVNRLDIVGVLSGAPAVLMPEACFVIDGLYSNV